MDRKNPRNWDQLQAETNQVSELSDEVARLKTQAVQKSRVGGMPNTDDWSDGDMRVVNDKGKHIIVYKSGGRLFKVEGVKI